MYVYLFIADLSFSVICVVCSLSSRILGSLLGPDYSSVPWWMQELLVECLMAESSENTNLPSSFTHQGRNGCLTTQTLQPQNPTNDKQAHIMDDNDCYSATQEWRVRFRLMWDAMQGRLTVVWSAVSLSTSPRSALRICIRNVLTVCELRRTIAIDEAIELFVF